MLRITVAFLEGADQRGQHFGVNGLLIQQFLGAHGCHRFLNGLQNIRLLLRNDRNGMLNLPIEMFFYPLQAFLGLRLGAAAAQAQPRKNPVVLFF